MVPPLRKPNRGSVCIPTTRQLHSKASSFYLRPERQTKNTQSSPAGNGKRAASISWACHPQGKHRTCKLILQQKPHSSEQDRTSTTARIDVHKTQKRNVELRGQKKQVKKERVQYFHLYTNPRRAKLNLIWFQDTWVVKLERTAEKDYHKIKDSSQLWGEGGVQGRWPHGECLRFGNVLIQNLGGEYIGILLLLFRLHAYILNTLLHK